jgi:translation initiation factor IF-2
MNITELARKLKLTTNELKDLLPQLGFDIGRKAIKVDDTSAQKIIDKIKSEPGIIERLRLEMRGVEEKEEVVTEKSMRDLVVPAVITVRDFATLVNRPVAAIIQELMKNGILANLNEQIDYETASIIAQDLGFKTAQQETENVRVMDEEKIGELLMDKTDLQPRSPVVIVMGHVDHGKTQLLDTIRKTKVMAQESGGITQHIGAYQVEKNNRLITFIDTPGHEAFTAMRSRGARIADIAIIVIAADDGIMPQTEEVIKIAENAQLPFIIAINKIDKPEADIERVKQQLAQKNLLPEDWGGKVICVPISAKTNQGIEDLLEHLLLLADMEKEKIMANPAREAIGTIIESHIDKGEGPVATVLIQAGTLRQGDIVQIGAVAGKIRAMRDYKSKQIDAAPPSMPVRILGLKAVPEVGEYLRVTDQKSLKIIMKNLKQQQASYRHQQSSHLSKTKKEDDKEKKKTFNTIIKTDMVGSQEALLQSLETLSTDDTTVTIVKKGLGNITDIDILQAESSGAVVYGFNVKVNQRAKEMAAEKNVPVRIYNVIYDLINDVKKEVEKLIVYKVEIIELGRAKVLAIFRTEKSHKIIGLMVTKGKIEKGGRVHILRNEQDIGHGTIEEIQQAKQAVEAVPSGTECGVQLKTATAVQVGDFLEIYKEELKK